MFEGINEVAILVTALLAVAVGSVWYSPVVFGNTWMKSLGMRPGDDVFPQKEMIVAVVKGMVTQIVFFTTLAILARDMATSVSFMELAVLLLVLLATQLMHVVIWEKRPIAYFLVNFGYSVLILFGGLGVITFWPW
jgi:hypothetical protein